MRHIEVDGHLWVQIQLTKGKCALIDAEDISLADVGAWYFSGNGYAARTAGRKHIFLHHLVCPCGAGMMPDHINGDKLDNRRCNLRVVTKAQNGWNVKLSRRNSSGHKGVKFHRGKWVASIFCDGVFYHLGRHERKEDAVAARVTAEISMFGEYRRAA
jgi:hypothetical protein